MFEARDLALLLRAGSLAAPIVPIEERTIGPSLGRDNIDRGVNAILVGYLLVVLFIGLWYRMFGMLANVALFVNATEPSAWPLAGRVRSCRSKQVTVPHS